MASTSLLMYIPSIVKKKKMKDSIVVFFPFFVGWLLNKKLNEDTRQLYYYSLSCPLIRLMPLWPDLCFLSR